MQYLPDDYINRILGKEPKPLTTEKYQSIRDHLSAHNLADKPDPSEVIPLSLPASLGSLDEELAEATADYDRAIYLVSQWLGYDIASAPNPDHYRMGSGWHYWSRSVKKWLKLPHPPQDGCTVYDIETVKVGGEWLPTCAVALTPKGLAVWRTDFTNMPRLVPFGCNNTVVGWNIGYDRQYVSSEYTLAPTGNRYVDMMSMWIVCAGMSNQQTTAWKAANKSDSIFAPLWLDSTTTNSLAEVYKHYFGTAIDKGVRDNIVNDGLPWVSQHMDDVIRYCYEDVIHTTELLQRLLPVWLLRRPHSVNRAGLVIMGNCKLPLSPTRYPGFYARVEEVKSSVSAEANELLMSYASDYMETHLDDTERTEQQSCLDWAPALTGKTKGQPLWYRKLKAKHRAGELTLSTRDVAMVLELTYLGEPLLWRVDPDDVDARGSCKGGWATNKHGYLPHPDKKGEKVTDLFIRGYEKLFDSGAIAGNARVRELLNKKISLINWVSIRTRVAEIKTEPALGGDYPLCLPPIVPCGTITGRSKDGGGSVWLVAPNPKPNRIGTELKSLVEAPAGYKLVGADVASEEAWLAGIFGDSLLGYCGSTPLGLSNVIGTKAAKTDIHSLAAGTINSSRDMAKTLVYAGLYGQGLKGCVDYLSRANPLWTVDRATSTAKQFLDGFKGRKDYHLGYYGGLASEAFNYMESLAEGAQPKTPLTAAWMSASLAGSGDFKPTRVNWICQSSGVDFRDMLLVLIESFARKLGVAMSLCIAIHDEVRYLVPDEQTKQAAHVLQLAHVYTRFAFIRALGLNNLPAGVAWFPEIDVDAVLRKDPLDPQTTPTQQPLPLGYILTPKDLL